MAEILSAVKDVFLYNRENFMFDRTVNQERVYHTQKMRVSQVRLYRDDLRDLFHLTITKMNSYLVINVLLLLFGCGFVYEGRLPEGTPAWLLWLWTMSLGSGVFYLLLSVLFGVHASITAQTLLTRTMIEWLRLPIPGVGEIVRASANPEEFEAVSAKSMLHVPLVGQYLRDLMASARGSAKHAQDPNDSSAGLRISVSRELKSRGGSEAQGQSRLHLMSHMDAGASLIRGHDDTQPWNSPADEYECREEYPNIRNRALATRLGGSRYTEFVEHFYAFRELQKFWDGYDCYSRVCMVVGMSFFLSAVCYMAMGYFLLAERYWGTWVFAVALPTFQFLHMLMNVRGLSNGEVLLMICCLTIPPLLACGAVSASLNETSTPSRVPALMSPVMYLFCLVWSFYIVVLTSKEDGRLPLNFVTAASIDVLGLIGDDEGREARKATTVQAKSDGLVSWFKRPFTMWTLAVDVRVADVVPPDPVIVAGQRLHLTGKLDTLETLWEEDRESEKQPEPEMRRLIRASYLSRILPWRTVWYAGTVISFMWFFCFLYSVLIATNVVSWGWPTETSH